MGKEAEMAMGAKTIRFGDEETSWLQAYADFVGKSFSEFVREAALEKAEDAADLLAYKEALADDDGATFSFDDVVKAAMTCE